MFKIPTFAIGYGLMVASYSLRKTIKKLIFFKVGRVQKNNDANVSRAKNEYKQKSEKLWSGECAITQ